MSAAPRDTGIGHGKVILFGEHAVVHGCPALALALPRGATATAAGADRDLLHVMPFDSEVSLSESGSDPDLMLLRDAFGTAFAGSPGERPHLRVSATLHVPAGAGLGASAALGVAVIRAVDAALGRRRTDEEMVKASMRWEQVFHGNPSGVDSSMACYGGVALFRKGQALSPVQMAAPPPLVVGHSGQAPSTKAMVESVGRQFARNPEKVQATFDAIEAIVHNGRSALERREFDRLGQLMTLNQQLLNTLLLSTTRLETMCRAAVEAGALGAKLTGGGGGGCMIAIAEDHAAAEQVRARLSTFDPNAFVVGEAQ